MATETKPQRASVARESSVGLGKQGLAPRGEVHWNLIAPELFRAAARRDEGEFAEMGPFVAVTTPHTGRSPNDKFVVKEPTSERDVDWGKVNQPLSAEKFELLLNDVKRYLNDRRSCSSRISTVAPIHHTACRCATSRRTRGTWRSCATCSSAPS